MTKTSIKIGLIKLIVCMLLAIAKIYGIISWSWWVVTLPIWISPIILIGICAGAAVVIAGIFIVVVILATFVGTTVFYYNVIRQALGL